MKLVKKSSQAFSQNTLIVGDRELVSAEYQVLLKQLNALKNWLSQADSDVIPGLTYFKKLQNRQGVDNFSGLWLKTYSEPLVNELISQIVGQSAQHVKNKVAGYLTQEWVASVVKPYQNNIAPFYPFAESGSDVSMRAMSEYFAPDSSVNQFEQNVLAHFLASDGVRQMAIFNKNTVLALNNEVTSYIEQYLSLQKSLYGQAGNLQFPVTITPQLMSPKLRSLEISAGKAGLTYTHGPLIASAFSWPQDFANNELTIALTNLSNQRKVISYKGDWSIYRLIAAHRIHANSKLLKVDFDQDLYVEFIVDGVADSNSTLSPQLFQKLYVPTQLINTK